MVHINLPQHQNRNLENNDVYRSALTSAERIDFTSSVQCLMNTPSKMPKDVAPGARSRYDDFTATHINNTLLMHVNGIFLSWHRHFLHLFEEALAEECGFRGTLPYWNWPWWANDLVNSPLFDGTTTSLGGDGYWNASVPASQNGNYTFPRGNGGGCIESGPFSNITTGFRLFHTTEILQTTLPADALDYAPHCVYRDLNTAITGLAHTPEVVDSLLSAPTIGDFQTVMDGNFSEESTYLAPHRGGHYGVGLSMADQFASPSDPAFYLHHGMIDNMWAQWQLQDPHVRTYALSGTVTTLNNPPSANATVDTVISFGFLDEPRRLGDLMDTREGGYCYRYEYAQECERPE